MCTLHLYARGGEKEMVSAERTQLVMTLIFKIFNIEFSSSQWFEVVLNFQLP